jgi:hypothetical protein
VKIKVDKKWSRKTNKTKSNETTKKFGKSKVRKNRGVKAREGIRNSCSKRLDNGIYVKSSLT